VNIVYLLTNVSKEGNPRKYVGQKQDCRLVDIDGVLSIIGNTGAVYTGSSSSYEFSNDLKNGHIFHASVLEEVPNRSLLAERERFWLQSLGVCSDDAYYNLSETAFHVHKEMQDKVVNIFGETYKQVAGNNSSASKRDNTAVRCGFTNSGELSFHIHSEQLKGLSGKAISNSLGQDNRHFASVYIGKYNMANAAIQLSGVGDTEKQIARDYLVKGASLNKISEMMGLEIPVVRVLCGSYNKRKHSLHHCAHYNRMTAPELELTIARLVVDGVPYEEVANKLSMSKRSVSRYFTSYFCKRFKSSDLE
jgi:FixJ family two-component response regulator